MRHPARSKSIEAALERVVERPFLRRASVSLPLLRGALLRAMEDELKPVVPSRYTITVSAEQLARVGDAREEWERELASYFMEALRSRGWSAIGEPRVTIAYDPALSGDQVRVAVEEPGLIHNGGTFPRAKNRGPTAVIALAALVLCLAVLAAVLRPDLLDALRGTRSQGAPASGMAPLGGAAGPAPWWNGTPGGILGRFTRDSGAGASEQGSRVPEGAVLRWRQGRTEGRQTRRRRGR